MIWENGIKTCIISYKKQITSPGSMHDTGCLGLVHWDDPEGWNGEGGGRRVHEVAQLCPTLSDPMDCSLPGFSVHGIFQARVLEWGAIAFSDDLT